jgi:hypothetical protein
MVQHGFHHPCIANSLTLGGKEGQTRQQEKKTTKKEANKKGRGEKKQNKARKGDLGKGKEQKRGTRTRRGRKKIPCVMPTGPNRGR